MGSVQILRKLRLVPIFNVTLSPKFPLTRVKVAKMFHGAFALLERSLRIDSRAWSIHLARLGLLGSIYFSLCFAQMTSFMFGAPGLRFFQWIAYLDVTFMTLLGIGFFSTSITEEKEEDTLGLMLMAGISPLGILAGKSGGRLWQSLLLIAVQYPFILLAVTMGGVMYAQVWSMTLALLAYMVLLAGFGLLCSTLARRSQTAGAWMVAGLIAYFVLPGFAAQCSSEHAAWLISDGRTQQPPTLWWTLIGVLAEICVYSKMDEILSSTFRGSAWSVQVISNIVAGSVCTGLSWLFFGVATRTPSTEASSRGLVTRHRSLSPFCAGRAWNNSFAWKDFHFVSGGIGMMLVRIAWYSGLGISALFIEMANDSNWAGWFPLLIFLIWLSVTIDAARVVSRSMNEEVRGQTLSSLMMLPHSPNQVVYSKLAGALMSWLPGPITGLAVVVLSPQMREGLGSMILDSNGGGLMLATSVLYISLIPHFAALMSLYVRWGAVALAICLTIAVYFVLTAGITIGFMAFAAAGFGTFGGGPGFVQLIIALVALVMLSLCVACHFAILLRVQALGSK